MSEAVTVRVGDARAYVTFSDSYDNVTTRSTNGELWGLRTRLRVPSLDASALVHLGDAQHAGMLAFFSGLAGEHPGWSGLKEWRTREGGLALACTHDGRATVAMATELRDTNLGWVARAVVPLDAAALDEIARELAQLLA
jgi:hypothetical protein